MSRKDDEWGRDIDLNRTRERDKDRDRVRSRKEGIDGRWERDKAPTKREGRSRSRSRSRDRERSNVAYGDRAMMTSRTAEALVPPVASLPSTSSGTQAGAAKSSKEELDRKKRERLEMVKNLITEGGAVAVQGPANASSSSTVGSAGGGRNEDDGTGAGGGDEEVDEEEQMRRLMGFGSFDSSKGKQVESNTSGAAVGAVSKHKARKYRQYMNRKGGFNRPLEKMN